MRKNGFAGVEKQEELFLFFYSCKTILAHLYYNHSNYQKILELYAFCFQF